MKKWLSMAAILPVLLLGACSPAQDQIVFALKPDKDPDRMMQEKSALEDFLSERLGKPVSVIIPLSGSVILEGFTNGTIDLGYISATEMVHAKSTDSATLLLAGEIDGKTSYSSYWVSLSEKPYESVKDLEGRRVAFSSRSSTSGFVIPFWDLHKKGLISGRDGPEAFFGDGNVWYGVGYVSAIEQVLAGEAEAAAVSYYVIEEDRHLTPEQKARLKKVTEQGPVPTHVIAASSRLPDEDVGRIKEALLEFNDDGNRALRDKLFTSKLVEVDPREHLEGITEAINLARNATR
jgi:phosphonate transport system substrate-binding protein